MWNWWKWKNDSFVNILFNEGKNIAFQKKKKFFIYLLSLLLLSLFRNIPSNEEVLTQSDIDIFSSYSNLQELYVINTK